MTETIIDPRSTALVLIDLQHGIVGLTLSPRSGESVVGRAAQLAQRFRERGAPVFLVRVATSDDNGDALTPETDAPPATGAPKPAEWATIVPEIGPRPGDFVITKRQWGAFYGTELELQLRRRGIRTIVLAGIATNIGVESTARDAYERGFHQILVEDAMTALSGEAHAMTVKAIFPRIGRIRSTAEVLGAL